MNGSFIFVNSWYTMNIKNKKESGKYDEVVAKNWKIIDVTSCSITSSGSINGNWVLD